MAGEWERIFDGKFDEFTQKYPSDSWRMMLEKVTKKHPLRREKKWERFLGERCYATFHCKKCDRTWESARGWVSFWVWREQVDGRRQWNVAVHIFGQKCLRCSAKNKHLDYVLGQVYGDEIEAVLSYLFMDIDYWIYKNDGYSDGDEKSIEEKRKAPLKEGIIEEDDVNGNEAIKSTRREGRHISFGCQACQQKVCRKKVKKNYAGKHEVTLE